jgi:hypothetical protein
MFIVPIILFLFFWSIYYFGPEHCILLLFDILTNPVPGIEFGGCDGESNDLNSFRWRVASITILLGDVLQGTSIYWQSKEHKAQPSLSMTVH